MTTDAKTEAEAFLAMQRSVEGISDPTWLRVAKDKFCQFAEHTALPRLTLEVVAECERLRELLKIAAEHFCESHCKPLWPGGPKVLCPKCCQMSKALQEPTR